MADERIKVDYDVDFDDVKAAEKATESLKAASEAAGKAADGVARATEKAGKSTADFGRSALEAGRVAQDFAQGGIGGIINNVEGLARALGGGPGLAGVLTLVGVGFLVLRKPVGDFIASMTEGGREIPKARDAVARLAEALGETKAKLDALKEGWDGSAASLAEYNRLTEESERLERQANEAREAAAAIEAQRRKERQGDAASMKAVSEATEKAGGVDKVVEDLAAARPGASAAAKVQLDQLTRERDEALAARSKGARPGQMAGIRAVINEEFGGRIAEAEKTFREAQQAAMDQARELWGRAAGGDQAAIREMHRSLPGRGFDHATEEGVAATRAALEAGEEQARRDKEWREGRARKAEERRKQEEREEQAKEDRIEQEMYAYDQDRRDSTDARMEQLRKDIEERDKEEQQRPQKERQAVQDRARNVAMVQEGRERAQLQQFAASQGVEIPSEQLGGVLESVKGFVGAGARLDDAILAAMYEFIRTTESNTRNVAALAAQMRTLQMRAHGMQQTMPTLTPFGRPEAPGDAANPGADANPLAAQVEWLTDEHYRASRRRRTPSLLSYGDW